MYGCSDFAKGCIVEPFGNNATAAKLSIRILTASPCARQLHAAVVLREHRDANDRQTKQK